MPLESDIALDFNALFTDFRTLQEQNVQYSSYSLSLCQKLILRFTRRPNFFFGYWVLENNILGKYRDLFHW